MIEERHPEHTERVQLLEVAAASAAAGEGTVARAGRLRQLAGQLAVSDADLAAVARHRRGPRAPDPGIARTARAAALHFHGVFRDSVGGAS